MAASPRQTRPLSAQPPRAKRPQTRTRRPGPSSGPNERSAQPPRLIALNKPFDVLCQFQDEQGRATLKDYVPVPGVYPAGRLDRDSEGLLLLTNDGRLQARISDPTHKMPKTYWVQVEGTVSPEHLQALCAGVLLNDGPTQPAQAMAIEPPTLWPRTPPVRFRKNVPTSWLSLTIQEGRNRQVRRMTAAVGLPTLRLVRVQIGPWALGTLAPGAFRDEAITQQSR